MGTIKTINRDLPMDIVLKVLMNYFGSLRKCFEYISAPQDHILLATMCTYVHECEAFKCYLSAALGHKQDSMIAISDKYRFLNTVTFQKRTIAAIYRTNDSPCRTIFPEIPSKTIVYVLRRSLYFPMPLEKALDSVVDILDRQLISKIPRFLEKQLFLRVSQECSATTISKLSRQMDVLAKYAGRSNHDNQ